MFIRQFYTSCLAQASYYIESEGQAAIIDPLRDVDAYIDLATARNASIRYVFITHFHADFVSGHLELAHKTGATIVFGPDAKPNYPALIAFDGKLLPLGECVVKVIHTPGHTIESACFLLYDENKEPSALFSGDTLFIGDVGRPDLLSGNLNAVELGAMLFQSIDLKLKPLPDNVMLYPGHGAGSACGKNMGQETIAILGEQKKNNPCLQMDKDTFIHYVTSDQPLAPSYFFKDASINKSGYPDLSTVLNESFRAFNPDEFKKQLDLGAAILDTTTIKGSSHTIIQNALYIGLNGQYAVWAGTLIDFEQPLLLVCDPGTEKEVITRLARIGFDKCIGYLKGGTAAWEAFGGATDTLETLDTNEDTFQKIQTNELTLLDVRRKNELGEVHYSSTVHIPLESLKEQVSYLDPDKSYAVMCAGGYRSLIAASLLLKAGFHKVYSINGGAAAVKTSSFQHLIEE